MHDHYLILHPNGESLKDRICELISYLFDNAYEVILSLLTNRSHLERLLQKTVAENSATHIAQIEKYLRKKGYIQQRKLRKYSEDELLKMNSVTLEGEYGEHLKERLTRVLNVFEAYDNLRTEVEHMRCQKFNDEDNAHLMLLQELWTRLMPNSDTYNRVGKHWRDIGFQGDDPATDFRGMGLLCLEQLVYFASNHIEDARGVLNLSYHAVYGFPMAIAGITITSLTRHLLMVGRLKKHFYNTNDHDEISMLAFHEAYCKIFVLFCDYWKRAEPDSVMSFNLVRLQFERSLADILLQDNASLHTIRIDYLS